MPKEQPNRWEKIAESEAELEFGPNQIAVSMLDGRKICIGRHKAQLFAFAYACPHAGGLFADGFIDALGNVVCPLHRYKYSMLTGRNMSGEGYYLKHWPVEIREDGVYVGVVDRGLFGFFNQNPR
jgi:nitrite reductase/ring-hydroxylating ferredoxin subunit